ncbi:MAG TPA: hypothetical protein PL054_08820 [Clostridia bacterium]|nr:hypothetical protein [Clostridia bacterium]
MPFTISNFFLANTGKNESIMKRVGQLIIDYVLTIQVKNGK